MSGFFGVAYAQDVPSSADPSRIESRLPPPVPKQRPQGPAISGGPNIITPNIPAGADQYNFVLNRIILDGVSAYPAGAFDDITSGYVGRTISAADLYVIAGRITQRYRDDGYILSSAILPEQEIEGGIITIKVVEGYIDDVIITGEDPPRYPVRKIIADIKSMRPMNVHQLERKLLLLEDIPGLSVQAILEPLKDKDAAGKPGAVLLNTVLTADPGETSVSLDNHGSKFVGPWQAGVRGLYPHRKIYTGETGVALFVSPRLKELAYLSLSESVPVSSNGLVVNGAVKYSKSQPGSTLSELELDSVYKSFNIGAEYPLILSRQQRLDVFGSFELNNISSDILSTRFYEDRLRVLRAGGRYQVTQDSGAISRGELTLSQGLDVFGARETGSIDLSRTEGESDFSKFTGTLSHYRSLGGDFALLGTVSGQYAPSPLLSSEEFGYGGSQMGRAYDNSEITGDRGIAFSIEVSYQGLINAGTGTITRPNIEPFIFYDAGKVWNHDMDIKPESGSSAGAGVRLGVGAGNLSMTAAQPLSRRVENPINGNGKNPRFLMSLQYGF